jgi:hypothetical protein
LEDQQIGLQKVGQSESPGTRAHAQLGLLVRLFCFSDGFLDFFNQFSVLVILLTDAYAHLVCLKERLSAYFVFIVSLNEFLEVADGQEAPHVSVEQVAQLV